MIEGYERVGCLFHYPDYWFIAGKIVQLDYLTSSYSKCTYCAVSFDTTEKVNGEFTFFWRNIMNLACGLQCRGTAVG